MNRILPLLLLLLLAGCDLRGATDPCPAEPVVAPTSTLQEDIVETEKAEGASSAAPTGDRPLPFVWVLDHSGSMYPGFAPGTGGRGTPFFVEDPAFRDFAVRTLGRTFRGGKDRAQIVLFNEKAWLWDGSRARPVDDGARFDEGAVTDLDGLAARLATVPPPPYGASVAGLPAPAKGATECSHPGAAANCSRMAVGLDAALALLEQAGGEGIVWLVTDNLYEGRTIGSDGLGDAELESNATFYRRLHDDPNLQMVYAWPMRHATEGGWLGSSSLFVYGIYYSKHGRPPLEELRRIGGEAGSPGALSSGGLETAMAGYASPQSPSPGRPFKLKPLDVDVVRIRLATQIEAAARTEFGQPVPMRARVLVENMLHHRRIDRLSFRIQNGKWIGYDVADGKPMATVRPLCSTDGFGSDTITIGPIEPGAKQEVEVTWAMPGVLTEWHTLGDLLQLGQNDHVVMGGALEAQLQELQTSLAIAETDLGDIYGVESLPAIFANPRNTSYTSRFAGHTRPVENPGTITALFALGGAVVLGLVVAGGMFLLRRVGRELVVNGTVMGPITVGRVLGTTIEHRGRPIASARLSFGGLVQVHGVRGSRATPEGRAWKIATPEGEQVRVELRPLGRGRSTTARAAPY